VGKGFLVFDEMSTINFVLFTFSSTRNLSYNRLSEIDSAAFEDLTNLQEV
jgi:hypothetical protein